MTGVRAEALRLTLEAAKLAGEIGANLILWPGIEGYNYPFQTPYTESWARLIDGIGEAAERCRGGRRAPVPRAQELRAGDEDLHAQRGHGPAHRPHPPDPGDRQRQVQHGLAAPADERREPARSTRPSSPPRDCWATSTRTQAGARFDDDNMVGTTAFMETLELAVELRRAHYGSNGEHLGFDLYPYTEDQVGGRAPGACSSGASSTKSPAHRPARTARGAAGKERSRRVRAGLRCARGLTRGPRAACPSTLARPTVPS